MTAPLRPLPRGRKKLIFGLVTLFLPGMNAMLPLAGLGHESSSILIGLGTVFILWGGLESLGKPPTHT